MRFEVTDAPEVELEALDVLLKEAPADTLIISEPNADAGVNVKLGALRLQYRFENIPTGLVDFSVLWRPKTGRLFLGGKRQSCVVNVATRTVEHVFEHCLFWGFSDGRPGFVLETGELDCLIRRDDGEIIARTTVDPPWELHHEPDGYRFESIVNGTTYLRYPR